mmetsp:Transcript_26755/g.56107  ORF Transcript_26755/g.56107 Transcript_26755/m.56107 type:complete len:103 (-) Transcript_26755:10-318(-)
MGILGEVSGAERKAELVGRPVDEGGAGAGGAVEGEGHGEGGGGGGGTAAECGELVGGAVGVGRGRERRGGGEEREEGGDGEDVQFHGGCFEYLRYLVCGDHD